MPGPCHGLQDGKGRDSTREMRIGHANELSANVDGLGCDDVRIGVGAGIGVFHETNIVTNVRIAN